MLHVVWASVCLVEKSAAYRELRQSRLEPKRATPVVGQLMRETGAISFWALIPDAVEEATYRETTKTVILRVCEDAQDQLAVWEEKEGRLCLKTEIAQS